MAEQKSLNAKQPSLFGWVLTIFVLYLISKSESGYRAIYFGCFLIFVFLLVFNNKTIAGLMVKDVNDTTEGTDKKDSSEGQEGSDGNYQALPGHDPNPWLTPDNSNIG